MSIRRDRALDAGLVALSAAGGVFLLATRPGALGSSGWVPGGHTVAIIVDLCLGAGTCALVLLRRRRPVETALIAAVPLALSLSAGVAAFATLFGVAARRRPAVALLVAVVQHAALMAYVVIWRPGYPLWAVWPVAAAEQTAMITSGMYVRAKAQVTESLQAQLAAAEAERQLLEDRARLAERTRIAQEMHDVLAHRISLIALHAGGLEVNSDLAPERVRDSAALLRTTAHQALQELRDVIGVLHDGSRPPHAPQPTLADIPDLVAESRVAGMTVDLDMRLEDPANAPGGLGRDGYRIVREALTNVRKHAPGCAAAVSLTGGPGQGLRVRIANPLPVGRTVPLPGAGTGLAALTERVTLAGGTISHGPADGGEFLVEAELRWDV